MKKVSARLNKLIQKASFVPYTNEELQKLHDLIVGDEVATWIDRWYKKIPDIFDYDSFKDAAHFQIKYGGLDIDRPVPVSIPQESLSVLSLCS